MRKSAFFLLGLGLAACASRLATPPVLFPLTDAWKVAPSESLESPLASDGERLFALRGDGNLEALSPSDGHPLWRRSVGGGRVTAAPGILLWHDDEGHLRRLDPGSGRILWEARSGLTGRVRCGLDRDAAFLLGAGLVAVALGDGRILWRATDGADGTSLPTASQERVFIGEEDGTLRCRDRATGATRWTLKTGSSLKAPVLLDGDRLLVGTTDGRFLAVAPEDGKIRWRWKIGADVSEAAVRFGASTVIFATYENVVYGLDRGNGHLKWRAPLPSRPASAPMLVGSALLVACQESELVALDARSGRKLGGATMPGEFKAPPLLIADRLFVALRDRSLLAYAFDMTPSREVERPRGPRPSEKPPRNPVPGRERPTGVVPVS